MKKYIRAEQFSRDEQFQQDLNSAVYNAVADTVFKYRDLIKDSEALEASVGLAVDWWSTHFFESDDWEG